MATAPPVLTLVGQPLSRSFFLQVRAFENSLSDRAAFSAIAGVPAIAGIRLVSLSTRGLISAIGQGIASADSTHRRTRSTQTRSRAADFTVGRPTSSFCGRQGMNRWQDVLRLHPKRRSQSTIRRFYDIWRQERGLPIRCDKPECHFHTAPLFWNDKPLKLILDHVDGNRFDNLPNSLRYLCPNCDSQLSTRGGANRGRVKEVSEDGYILRNRDGSTIAASTFRASGSSTAVFVGETVTGTPSDSVTQAIPSDSTD